MRQSFKAGAAFSQSGEFRVAAAAFWIAVPGEADAADEIMLSSFARGFTRFDAVRAKYRREPWYGHVQGNFLYLMLPHDAAWLRANRQAFLVGTPWLEDGKLYNAAALLENGSIAALRFKVDLPNYGVFDEKRVFVPGPLPGPLNFRGVRIGRIAADARPSNPNLNCDRRRSRVSDCGLAPSSPSELLVLPR